MWACTEQIVPDPADGFGTGEVMREPGQYPRDDEGQHPHLCKAFKDLLEIWIPLRQQLKHQITDDRPNGSNILRQEIFEVSPACLLHHVVPRIIAEQDQEDGSDIVEALDVPQCFILGKEAIEDLEDVSLLLLAEYRFNYRWNFDMFSKVFILASERSASFCNCS